MLSHHPPLYLFIKLIDFFFCWSNEQVKYATFILQQKQKTGLQVKEPLQSKIIKETIQSEINFLQLGAKSLSFTKWKM